MGTGTGPERQQDAELMSEAGAEPEPDLEAAADLEPDGEAVPEAELEADAEPDPKGESEAAGEPATTIKLRPTRATPPAGTPAARASSDALSSLSLPARLEAILYLKGRPLGLAELAEIAGIDRDQAEMALITLMTDYAHRDTALEIRQEGQRYSLQLRESLSDLVQSLLPVDLSTAALRTLATIALKKRILQSELVDLRGSGAYDHIKELLAQEFIERRRQSEGRSYWLSLSEKFHRTFAVSADDLGQRRRQAA
jgi:segregation and condensation protein B